MDRQTLLAEVKQGPIRVFMNDGTWHDIPSVGFCLVDQIAARVLYRDDAGVWRTKVLSLVCGLYEQNRALARSTLKLGYRTSCSALVLGMTGIYTSSGCLSSGHIQDAFSAIIRF